MNKKEANEKSKNNITISKMTHIYRIDMSLLGKPVEIWATRKELKSLLKLLLEEGFDERLY